MYNISGHLERYRHCSILLCEAMEISKALKPRPTRWILATFQGPMSRTLEALKHPVYAPEATTIQQRLGQFTLS